MEDSILDFLDGKKVRGISNLVTIVGRNKIADLLEKHEKSIALSFVSIVSRKE